MAEIGLAASIIAVVDLIGKVTSLGYSYLRGVKQAPKDIGELVRELGSLSSILIDVQNLADQNPQLHTLQKLNSNDGPLHGITEELNKLITKLGSTSKKVLGRSMKRLKWPLQVTETMQHISRIERHKASFIFALSADQISLSSGIARDLQDSNIAVQEIRRLAQDTSLTVGDIKNLIQNTNLTVKDIRTLSENTDFRLHDIQDLVKKINCTVNDTQHLAQSTDLVLRAIETDASRISRTVEDIKVDSENQNFQRQNEEDRRRVEKRRNVLNWLSLEDFQSKHDETSKRRQKNTGQWILQTPQYRQWLRGQNNRRLLFGCGIPGAGKTFISSSVIDHLQAQASSEDYGVAYIYFDYQNQTQQSPDLVIASLVKQLAYRLMDLPIEIETLHKNREHEGKRPTMKELYSTLLAIAKSFTQVFFVFDALDEYNQENQRGELLELFHSMEENGINLFLTSRPYPEDVQDSLQNAVRIEILAKEEDIRLYIQEKIGKNPRARRLVFQGNLKDKIISELVDCAQGMFLLVRFHIEYICQKTTKNQILMTLERLRNSSSKEKPLDPTYDRAMGNIRRKSKPCMELVLRVFSWLVKARRTLTVDEIQVAVSIEQDLYELDEGDLPDRNTLLDVCAGLVIIDEDSRTVRLAHYTVQDYLIRTSTIPKDADFQVAVACTTYLSFDVFAKGACTSNDAVKARHQSHPFLNYAVHQLGSHLKLCDEELSKDAVQLFVQCSGIVSSYLQALYFPTNTWKSSGYDSYPKGRHALHVAAALGHSTVIRMLLDNGTCISVLDSHRHTALHIAASEGQEAVVELLVQEGADASIPNHHGQTPLHTAASEGHEEVVQVLLKRGVDISTPDYLGYTALHYAATGSLSLNSSLQPLHLTSQKRMRVIQVFFDNGASISTTTNSGRTALHMAVYRGDDRSAQLLVRLANRAEISVQDNNGQTPLHLATSRLNETMVRILVENGADHSRHNNEGSTPLDIAIMKGHLRLVGVLLESGVGRPTKDIPAVIFLEIIRKAVREGSIEMVQELSKIQPKAWTGGYTFLKEIVDWGQEAMLELLYKTMPNILGIGESVLKCVVLEKNVAVIKLLLDIGDYKDCILHLAVYGGETVVKLLLDNGADISALDKNGNYVLHLAARKTKNEAMVKLLLDSGTDISSLDGNGGNALHLAMREKWDEDVVKHLLDSGADTSSLDRNGNNALHLAVVHGGKTLVKLLLDSGADISSLNGNGNNALRLAINKPQNEDLVKLLLDSGADISSLDRNGNNALHLAVVHGGKTLVKLLLDSGADISSLDRDGNNALHLAVVYRGKTLVKLLLDNGADISSLNVNGNNTLHLAMVYGGETVVKLLLDSGADISFLNVNGDNALHLAVVYRGKTLVKLLLDSGADISSLNVNGNNALHLAMVYGGETVVKLLLDSGADISFLNVNGNNALHLAVSKPQNKDVVKLLLDSGADISSLNGNGNAIHLAVVYGDETVVKLLLDSGADISSLDRYGNNALHVAVRKTQNEAMVKLLLDSGADISSLDRYGNNALHVAVSRSQNEDVVKLLLDRGVDTSALDGSRNNVFLPPNQVLQTIRDKSK